MNPFSAIGSLFASWFLTGQRAAEEREQQGSEGAAYSDDLKAQYDAYYKAHGTSEGFVYKEPK